MLQIHVISKRSACVGTSGTSEWMFFVSAIMHAGYSFTSLTPREKSADLPPTLLQLNLARKACFNLSSCDCPSPKPWLKQLCTDSQRNATSISHLGTERQMGNSAPGVKTLFEQSHFKDLLLQLYEKKIALWSLRWFETPECTRRKHSDQNTATWTQWPEHSELNAVTQTQISRCTNDQFKTVIFIT